MLPVRIHQNCDSLTFQFPVKTPYGVIQVPFFFFFTDRLDYRASIPAPFSSYILLLTTLLFYWFISLFMHQSIHSVVSPSRPIPRGRMHTCNDSSGRSTPPAAPVFCGTWRRRRTTSSRSSRLASTERAKPARRSIFAPSRRQTASPPTPLTRVCCSEMTFTCSLLHFVGLLFGFKWSILFVVRYSAEVYAMAATSRTTWNASELFQCKSAPLLNNQCTSFVHPNNSMVSISVKSNL